MKKLLTIIGIFFLFSASAKKIVVGRCQSFTSLKKAVLIANDKDTILLNAGVYREGNIPITKSISIIGIGNPVLDGENKYEILTISGKNITISGITFRNSAYSAWNDYASIKIVDASNITIENNTIINAFFAIHVSNTSYAVIRHNTIMGSPKSELLSGNAIHLWKSTHALIDGNHVQGHRDGIYFEFVSFSKIQ